MARHKRRSEASVILSCMLHARGDIVAARLYLRRRIVGATANEPSSADSNYEYALSRDDDMYMSTSSSIKMLAMSARRAEDRCDTMEQVVGARIVSMSEPSKPS